MILAAVTFWWFVVYVGTDWESPAARIFSIHGPYGSRSDCAEVQREHWVISGNMAKSPCFKQIVGATS